MGYKKGRSKKALTYHGRTGHPILHETDTGKEFIMVRATGGGTKKLFLKNGDVPHHLQKAVKHRR